MYKQMANIYDELMQDAPYDEWCKFTEEVIEGKEVRSILEIGCGTGEIAIQLAEKGYQVTAFDQSKDMIEVAEQKLNNQEESCQFDVRDARYFSYEQTFDTLISYCDVLNYITDVNDVELVLKNAYQHLRPGGLFVFDVHSQSYVNWLIDEEIFSEIRDDISYVWMCEPLEHEGGIRHDLTFFVKQSDGLYKRLDEEHVQQTHSVKTYQDLLQNAGFRHVNVYQDFTLDQLVDEEQANRLFFVCEK
ncbi:class I SAM-dependent DNA methyltransferase [Aquisalibacillus elongatus]|uniref:Methyltransferase family protein n=1 Tax=Aquisalibacillus elongatus TaxID=485577 RepID=A0A3N5BCW1_9BACI|nr:class I SAM-dependent methyltransferase [Aquisalibacillus elongatus]RPF55566.1 methyltransferase family protein [Aquisalibacillus elongatus]